MTSVTSSLCQFCHLIAKKRVCGLALPDQPPDFPIYKPTLAIPLAIPLPLASYVSPGDLLKTLEDPSQPIPHVVRADHLWEKRLGRQKPVRGTVPRHILPQLPQLPSPARQAKRVHIFLVHSCAANLLGQPVAVPHMQLASGLQDRGPVAQGDERAAASEAVSSRSCYVRTYCCI